MPPYSPKKIKSFFTKAAAAKTKAEKGKLLEDLACYLFEEIPGITLSARNVKNTCETEEIDVAFWNGQHPRGLKELNFVILVECKNWAKPVGSMEVNWFITKVRNRALDFGVLLAANGITGDADDRKEAHDVVSKALMEKIRVVILTRAEIEALADSAGLVTTIKRKLCELIVSGTVWP